MSNIATPTSPVISSLVLGEQEEPEYRSAFVLDDRTETTANNVAIGTLQNLGLPSFGVLSSSVSNNSSPFFSPFKRTKTESPDTTTSGDARSPYTDEQESVNPAPDAVATKEPNGLSRDGGHCDFPDDWGSVPLPALRPLLDGSCDAFATKKPKARHRYTGSFDSQKFSRTNPNGVTTPTRTAAATFINSSGVSPTPAISDGSSTGQQYRTIEEARDNLTNRITDICNKKISDFYDKQTSGRDTELTKVMLVRTKSPSRAKRTPYSFKVSYRSSKGTASKGYDLIIRDLSDPGDLACVQKINEFFLANSNTLYDLGKTNNLENRLPLLNYSALDFIISSLHSSKQKECEEPRDALESLGSITSQVADSEGDPSYATIGQ
ncbi:MAG: hypothetical protein WCF19_04310 [Chlamydiales bacterium]